jgi:hypothetical protein
MQTSGHGNDWWMTFLLVGVTMVIGTILFGGPTNAAEAIDAIMREVAVEALALASALFR